MLSHIASFIVYANNRDRTILLLEATDLAARIVGIVNLASDLTGKDRQTILTTAETQFLAMLPATDTPKTNRCESNKFLERISHHLSKEFKKT